MWVSLFPGQQINTGDQVQFRFVYDGDLGSRSASPELFTYSGGTRYGNGTSPILSTTVSFAGVDYNLSADYFGYISILGSYVFQLDEYRTGITVYADPSEVYSIAFSFSSRGSEPQQIYLPDETASYALQFSTREQALIQKLILDPGEPFSAGLINVSITDLSIAPYIVEEPPTAPVPLPAAAPLLLGGIAAVAAVRRRKR